MRSVLAAVIIAVILGLVLQGTFFHWVLVLGICIWIGLPVALVLAIWWLLDRKKEGGIPAQMKTTSRVVLVTVCALILSLGVGVGVHQWTVFRMRAFVEATVPKLDQFRSWSGRFPVELDELGDIHVPALLTKPGSFFSDGDSFRFIYWDASGMMDGYYFDSVTRRWTYFD